MRRFTIALLTAVSSIVLTQMASAADLPRKAPAYQPPPPPPPLTWNGWYLGLNAGAGWGNNDGIDNTVNSNACTIPVVGACDATIPVMNANIPGQFDTGNKAGFIGGGQVGYNWQWSPQVVWGLEADFQGADIKGDSSFATGPLPIPGFINVLSLSGSGSQKLNFLGTLRGRLGWVPAAPWLLFVTGGLAYGHLETDLAFAGHITSPFSPFNGSTAVSNDEWRAGWTIGGGLEWMFAPQWSLKAEYLYYDLGHVTIDQTLSLVNGPGDFVSANISSEAHYKGSIARAGINYHFGAY